jgi:cytidylate kinase
MKESRFIIAIDGFAGTGKSSISKEVARRLGYTYLGTGFLYRAVGLACITAGVSPDDSEVVTRITKELKLSMRNDPATGEPQVCSVSRCWFQRELLSEEISDAASRVAIHIPMRKELISVQREAYLGQPIVAEGRDMTTTIFPHAQVKVFINVPSRIRAERRVKQLQASGNVVPPIEVIQKDIEARDIRDSENREFGATKIPEDGVVVENTGTFEECVGRIIALVKSRSGTP